MFALTKACIHVNRTTSHSLHCGSWFCLVFLDSGHCALLLPKRHTVKGKISTTAKSVPVNKQKLPKHLHFADISTANEM